MSAPTDMYTGWSSLLVYNATTQRPQEPDSYTPFTGFTIFAKNWFNRSQIAYRYVNVTTMHQKLSSMTLTAVTCNSNGSQFITDSHDTVAASGDGCELVTDVYAKDYTLPACSSTRLDSIDKYNCYYLGYGKTSAGTEDTCFGLGTFFGPGMYEPDSSTPADVDSQGRKRYRHQITFSFENSVPLIAPNESIFIHIRPSTWTSVGDSCAIGIWGHGSYMIPQLIPTSTYVNKKQLEGWKKVETANIYKDQTWIEMGDNY